jgi:hypothetical protein
LVISVIKRLLITQYKEIDSFPKIPTHPDAPEKKTNLLQNIDAKITEKIKSGHANLFLFIDLNVTLKMASISSRVQATQSLHYQELLNLSDIDE